MNFFAGDTTHPKILVICQFVDAIDRRLELVGYGPDYSEAPIVGERHDGRQQTLRVHSESLAIALGLLSLKQEYK